MAKFTLDDINKAAEEQFGSLDIEIAPGNEVRLLNPMRHSAERRAELVSVQSELDDIQDRAEEAETQEEQEKLLNEQERILDRLIILVAENQRAGEKLLEKLGDDLAVKMTVFNKYNEGTQAGEASTSPS